MEDVLTIYKRPYDPDFPVVCMDETNKQQLLDKRAPIKMKPGSPQKFDTEYERNGTSNIFMAFEPLAGKRFVQVTARRTKKDWARYIQKLVDDVYPNAKKLVLVMDNLNTHKGASLYEVFEPAEARRILDKLEIHYTPKHGSWLNMAELELSHLSRQCLNRRIPDQKTLKEEVTAWCIERNERKVKVDWQFTTDDARIKLKKLYPILEPIDK
jgi:transposase